MKPLADIAASITLAEKSLERERGVVESLAERGEKAVQLAAEAQQQASWYEEAAKLLAQFSDERQAEVIKVVQDIASVGLSQVFDEEIQLVVTPVVRARRIEMDVKIKTGELETSIIDARGGGLAAVAGFLLRACVLLLTPNVRRILILDEVFAHLSEDYVPRLAEFLRELCEETGLQVILVTHQAEFTDAAHKVHRIERTSADSAKFVEES